MIASWWEAGINKTEPKANQRLAWTLVAVGIKIGSKQLQNSTENHFEEVLFPFSALAKSAYPFFRLSPLPAYWSLVNLQQIYFCKWNSKLPPTIYFFKCKFSQSTKTGSTSQSLIFARQHCAEWCFGLGLMFSNTLLLMEHIICLHATGKHNKSGRIYLMFKMSSFFNPGLCMHNCTFRHAKTVGVFALTTQTLFSQQLSVNIF